ncbi:MAG TPA: hypothetical protein VMR59_03690 [Patescibacteria group bacterium]|jgi:hypothetical protein|nr:hypothetical protein [Patescibacteria group bacterium]
MTEPIDTKSTDWGHGQRVAGMRSERPTAAHYQAHEKPRPLHIGEGLSRRLHGLAGTLRNLTESLNPEQQVPFGQISEIYLAKMLAGQLSEDHAPQGEQFSRTEAFATLGYHNRNRNPREYAAMLYAHGLLVEDGGLKVVNDSNGQMEPQLKPNMHRIREIAGRNPAEDSSLSRTLMLGTEQDQDAVVQRILREHNIPR